MTELDETDRQILRLLLEDARRPYSDIADHVDLSPPAVSDRIDRLNQLGVIQGFTVDLDRSMLTEGTPVLVHVSTPPDVAAATADALGDLPAVEHVFRSADGNIFFKAAVRSHDVTELFDGTIPTDDIDEVEVQLLADSMWSPNVADATLALTCAECGNAVTSEGTSARIGDTLYHFCCPSCENVFQQRYAELEEDA
jgi:DNA-binding Lrp family transcriptional regulator